MQITRKVLAMYRQVAVAGELTSRDLDPSPSANRYQCKMLDKLVAAGFLICSHPFGARVNKYTPPRKWRIVLNVAPPVFAKRKSQMKGKTLARARGETPRQSHNAGNVPGWVGERMGLAGLVAQLGVK